MMQHPINTSKRYLGRAKRTVGGMCIDCSGFEEFWSTCYLQSYQYHYWVGYSARSDSIVTQWQKKVSEKMIWQKKKKLFSFKIFFPVAHPWCSRLRCIQRVSLDNTLSIQILISRLSLKATFTANRKWQGLPGQPVWSRKATVSASPVKSTPHYNDILGFQMNLVFKWSISGSSRLLISSCCNQIFYRGGC